MRKEKKQKERERGLIWTGLQNKWSKWACYVMFNKLVGASKLEIEACLDQISSN